MDLSIYFESRKFRQPYLERTQSVGIVCVLWALLSGPIYFWKKGARIEAMLLAVAAVLDHAAARGDPGTAVAAGALRAATLGAASDGIRTFDLGGDSSTTDVVDEVISRLRSSTG